MNAAMKIEKTIPLRLNTASASIATSSTPRAAVAPQMKGRSITRRGGWSKGSDAGIGSTVVDATTGAARGSTTAAGASPAAAAAAAAGLRGRAAGAAAPGSLFAGLIDGSSTWLNTRGAGRWRGSPDPDETAGESSYQGDVPAHRPAQYSAMEFFLGGLIVFVIDWIIRIAALIVIPRDRKPTAAMAWLLAIFLIPIIGVILYLLIGSYKLPKARLEKQKLHRRGDLRAHGRRRDRRGCRGRPGLAARHRAHEPHAHGDPGGGRQLGHAHRGLPGVDRRDGGRHRHGDHLRAHRVLHRRVRRHDARLLRGDGARGRARRDRARCWPTTWPRRAPRTRRRRSPSSTASA